MEVIGLPPPNQLAKLAWRTTALVDDALSPLHAVKQQLPGISAASMAGAPGKGGWGLLPLQQHVQPRHA